MRRLLPLLLLLLLPGSASASSLVEIDPGQIRASQSDIFYIKGRPALLAREGQRIPSGAKILVKNLEQRSRAFRLRENLSGRSSLPTGRSSYRYYDEYLREIYKMQKLYPEQIKLWKIGSSVYGRPIIAIELSFSSAQGKPALIQSGLHHAREWPTGELIMEFLWDSLRSRPRALEKIDLWSVPIANPDGFIVSRGAAASERRYRAGWGEYHRKNCRYTSPCERSLGGVDLNRNYGYYWGGVGSSAAKQSEIYRGPAPFSEPESQAIKNLSSKIPATVFLSHHTFSAGGQWLRQPGFLDQALFPKGKTPDEDLLRDLGDSMAASSGWQSDPSWLIGSITGATEDWNYFAQASLGYTSEFPGRDFHDFYSRGVVSNYPGFKRSVLLAAQGAASKSNHATLQIKAPPGQKITISKTIAEPRCSGFSAALGCLAPVEGGQAQIMQEVIIPPSGNISWSTNPSRRPLQAEPWQMSCSGKKLASLEIGRGEVLSITIDAVDCGEEKQLSGFSRWSPKRSPATKIELSPKRCRANKTQILWVNGESPTRQIRWSIGARGGRISRTMPRGKHNFWVKIEDGARSKKLFKSFFCR